MYIKQRSKTTCAPIAIRNALSWAGDKTFNLPKIKKLCAHCPIEGTRFHAFDEALRELGKNKFKVRRCSSITPNRVIKNIKSGKAAIFIHKTSSGGHCIFIPGAVVEGITTINGLQEEMSECLLEELLDQPFVLWFLTK